MKEKYSIGQYEFDTYEEYLDGLDDVKKIKSIIHEVDIYDADASLRLYKLLRQNKITFKGKVGNGFFCYVSDIVADNSRKLTIKEYENSLGEPQNSKARTFIGYALIAAAIVCAIIFTVQQIRSSGNAKELEELQSMRQEAQQEYASDYSSPIEDDITSEEQDANAQGDSQEIASSQEVLPQTTSLSILPEFEELYDQNNDLVGWLEIEGTQINYPVMQIEDDNTYYLKHNFNKKRDNNGSLFLDGRNSFATNRDDNLIIYGHNMRSGKMFGTLKQYLEEDYYNEHQTITFDTIYEKATYTVVGAGLSQVSYQDEDTFRYYDFLDAENEEEFNKIISKLNKLIVCGDMDVSYGDELLTLSTCNSYVEDGRMFVIAKKG